MRGVAASGAFSRNAPLSSIIAAAMWSSSSVFTSFYLTDVQFSSSNGFGFGPLVAAGSGVGVFNCVTFSCVVLYVFCLLLCVRFPSFAAGSGYPLEGGVLALLRFSTSSGFSPIERCPWG